MLRENKAFSAVLTKVQSKAKDEGVVMSYTLRHIEEGDNQMFLTSYADKCSQENIALLFRYPVQWRTINIEAAYRFKVEFDAIEFEAILKSIKARRSFKQGIEYFTYQLEFEKEIEKDSDLIFTTYLNQKELGDDGKKRLIEYSVYLTPLEALMKA